MRKSGQPVHLSTHCVLYLDKKQTKREVTEHKSLVKIIQRHLCDLYLGTAVVIFGITTVLVGPLVQALVDLRC